MDIRNPVGSRVTSIRYQGAELPEDRTLTLCMNNYRSSGTGGGSRGRRRGEED